MRWARGVYYVSSTALTLCAFGSLWYGDVERAIFYQVVALGSLLLVIADILGDQ